MIKSLTVDIDNRICDCSPVCWVATFNFDDDELVVGVKCKTCGARCSQPITADRMRFNLLAKEAKK
jgi:hypothetical protein